MTNHRHFLIHKPYGVLSQFVNNQNRRKNKQLLSDLHAFPDGTMSVGRLDEKSEGLLLLTTNGIVSAQVRSKAVEKEYYVQVDGLITQKAIDQIAEGVEISINGKKYNTLPCKASILNTPPDVFPRRKHIRNERHGPTSWVTVTINEGKYRQVRKMTAAVGFPTLRLIRVRIGNLTLGNLAPGDFREVEEAQLP